MNVAQSIKTCLVKYAVFEGRASRSEFWWFNLFAAIISSLACYIAIISLLTYNNEVGYIALAVNLFITLPVLSVGARRLHDVDKSGWWQLLWITIVGGLIVIIWQATIGDYKANRYGESLADQDRNTVQQDKQNWFAILIFLAFGFVVLGSIVYTGHLIQFPDQFIDAKPGALEDVKNNKIRVNPLEKYSYVFMSGDNLVYMDTESINKSDQILDFRLVANEVYRRSDGVKSSVSDIKVVCLTDGSMIFLAWNVKYYTEDFGGGRMLREESMAISDPVIGRGSNMYNAVIKYCN